MDTNTTEASETNITSSESSEAQTGTTEFFLFELDHELYAVSALDVEQILKVPPVTVVPNAPRAILGIFHLRGGVIVVLDLLKRMQLERARAAVSNYLFITRHVQNRYAILIDQPRAVLRIPLGEVRPLDQMTASHIPPRYAKGIFLYTEPKEHKSNHTKPEIMIEAHHEKAERGSEAGEGTQRPVLWLNMDAILDQEDLSHLFTSQGAG